MVMLREVRNYSLAMGAFYFFYSSNKNAKCDTTDPKRNNLVWLNIQNLVIVH